MNLDQIADSMYANTSHMVSAGADLDASLESLHRYAASSSSSDTSFTLPSKVNDSILLTMQTQNDILHRENRVLHSEVAALKIQLRDSREEVGCSSSQCFSDDCLTCLTLPAPRCPMPLVFCCSHDFPGVFVSYRSNPSTRLT